MNSEGKYTDSSGRVLTVGAGVQVAKAEGDVYGTGVVISLPLEGNDWYGFPYVRLNHTGKLHHIPDSNLRLLYEDSLVGHLEKAIDETKKRNAQLQGLADTLRGADSE